MSNQTIPWFYPMGGVSDEKRLESGIWTDKNWVVERKFDGSRYLLRVETDGTVNLTSRSKSVETGLPTNKIQNVPHLKKIASSFPQGTILDGEIITSVSSDTSSNVVEIMGCDPEKAIERQKERGFVKYVVYDILYVNGQLLMDLKWYVRRNILENFYGEFLNGQESIFLTEFHKCDRFDAKAWYEKIVGNGWEGVMLKNVNSTYQAGLDKMKKPSNTWIKVKKFITEDCIILGFTDAEVEYTGKDVDNWEYKIDGKPVTKFHYNAWIGAVRFGQYDKNGRLVEVGQCSGMTEEVRKYMSEHKEELIGKVIEVKGMERIGKTLAIRHPEFKCFRPDKNPDECIIVYEPKGE